MMLLNVDEGFAFDYLSILEVKAKLCPTKQNVINFQSCFLHIQKHCGKTLTKNICQSDSYLYLIDVNTKIFNAIECLRTTQKGSAEHIDSLNLERWRIKKQLQKQFFETECLETKTSHS